MKKIIVLLLCCFFIICVRAQSDSLLMYVGEKPVSKSEFVYAYQKSGSISIHEFLSRYVKIKRWACAAEKMRLDTTQSFINRYSLYEQQVKKLVTADAQDANRCVETGNLYIAHLFVRIPQKTSYKDIDQLQCQFDSLYQSIGKNGRFDIWIRENRKTLPKEWNAEIQEVIPSQLLTDLSSCLSSLEKGILSKPFFSPVGIHMIQKLDSVYDEADSIKNVNLEDKRWLLSEYRDGLLIQMLEDSLCSVKENVLEEFYRKHRRHYRWKLPHFKGIVLQSSDKIKLDNLEKCLHGYPQEMWLQIIERLKKTSDLSWLKMDYGLFQIGTNACVDKLYFGQGDFHPSTDYPYVKVLGKVLKKKPESYLDVYKRVKVDYCKSRLEKEDAFLKKKIKVEINEEVLKTVNNHEAI